MDSLRQELARHAVLVSLFNQAKRFLTENQMTVERENQTVRFGITVSPEDVLLCGEAARLFRLEGCAQAIALRVESTR
jgi:hypothetical protein